MSATTRHQQRQASNTSNRDQAAPPLVLVVAVGFVVAYLLVAATRIVYPYDLDLLEDGMAMEALRFAQGLPVFVPPNADFVPHIYMPFYPWLGGLVIRAASLLSGSLAVDAMPLFWLRALSLAATLTTALLIYVIARREAAGRKLAFVSAGLFLAGFQIAGGWYDLARVDALAVALVMAGSALAVYGKDRGAGLVGAACLLALAFLTKQTGLAFGVVAAAYLLLAVGRRVWLFALTYAVVAAVPVLLLQAASQGWFATYVFDIAASSPLELRRLVFTVGAEFLGAMFVLTAGFLVLAAALFIQLLKNNRGAGGRGYLSAGRDLIVAQPWMLFTAAAILVSAAGRSAVGGDRNHLIQSYAFLCLVPALAMRYVDALPAPRARQLRTLVWLALLVQFALTMFNPVTWLLGYQRTDSFVPSRALRASGDQFIARLHDTPGDVFVMNHPLYALEAGKSPAVQVQPLWHARHRGQDPLPDDLVDRIESHAYSKIISDESAYFETEPALLSLIEANYVVEERLDASQSPATINGFIVRPQVVYVPR